MEIGVHLVATKDLYRVAERYTGLLDRISPDCVWLSDRLLVDGCGELAARCGESVDTWGEPPEFLDPFVTAAALVQYMPQPTRFGIAATDLVRRGPLDLARTAYTLNQVLPTPLNLGLGAGEAINRSPPDYVRGTQPVAHFERCLQQFRQINDRGLPQADQSVVLGDARHASSIWVAGQRPHMLRLAAAYADGWLPAWKMSADCYQDSASALHRIAVDAGRNCPKLGLFAMPVIGPSKQALLDYFRGSAMSRAVAFMAAGELWKKWGLQHPADKGSQGLFDVALSEIPADILHRALLTVPAEMIDDILFLGSLQELLDEFWRFRQAGMQHLSLLLPDFSSARISCGVDNFDSEFDLLCREIQSW